jgi:hypothetical protein
MTNQWSGKIQYKPTDEINDIIIQDLFTYLFGLMIKRMQEKVI